MQRILSGLLCGAIFGLGIAISGMGNPAKVLNFFDVFGTWDPSLALVMVSALGVTAIGYRVLFGRRSAPVFDTAFQLPTARGIDARLVGGSALFGVGWGMTGFCPGGAVPALGYGFGPTATFLIAMAAGMLIATYMQTRTRLRAA